MVCTNPNHALIICYKDGAKTTKFLEHRPYTPAEIEKFVSAHSHVLKYFETYPPCGKCASCKRAYYRTWAIRCMHESMLYPISSFVTLTYDNDHVPTLPVNDYVLANKVDPKKFVGFSHKDSVQVLNMDDVSSFMKRLRYYLDKDDYKVRFYAVGEYGKKNKRPHYHAILFGYFPSDIVLVGYSGDKVKRPIYRSPFLESVWKKGHVYVGNVTYESCAYVARYVNKKVENSDSPFKEDSRMSRNPGIGHDYFLMYYKDWYSYDNLKIRIQGKIQERPIPRYYDKLYSNIDPLDYLSIKDKRLEKAASLGSPFNDFGNPISNLVARDFIDLESLDHLIRPLHDYEVEDLFDSYDSLEV